MQQVQSPRPQLINNYLSNYNGVPEPPRVTSPSGHPVVIATSRPQTPPLLAPTSSPRTPGTPKQQPDPDYSDIKTEKHQTQLENLFLLKSPTRRLTEYLREPEPELVNPSEPVKYPAPDEDTIPVQIYQPADVIVRPPSPEVDYSFREFNPHTPGNLGNKSTLLLIKLKHGKIAFNIFRNIIEVPIRSCEIVVLTKIKLQNFYSPQKYKTSDISDMYFKNSK